VRSQELLFAMRVVESVELKVKKPMEMEIDNKGSIDLTTNWSASGRTKHMGTWHYFLRDLKEENALVQTWILTDENSSDLFTWNLGEAKFEKFAKVHCTDD